MYILGRLVVNVPERTLMCNDMFLLAYGARVHLGRSGSRRPGIGIAQVNLSHLSIVTKAFFLRSRFSPPRYASADVFGSQTFLHAIYFRCR